MLVLNRRPGESIVIEPDLRVTVLSVVDRRVWIGMRSEGEIPELRISATVVSPTEARLEIAPMSSVHFEGDRVRITAAQDHGAAVAARAALAVDRKPGERVEIGEDLWVGISSVSKGNPSLTFGGAAIGDDFSITLIRPAGSYVRLGVDAPNRRVYREELWDAVRAAGDNRAAPNGAVPVAPDGDNVLAEGPLLDTSLLDAPLRPAPLLGGPLLEQPAAPIPETVISAAATADVAAAGSAAS